MSSIGTIKAPKINHFKHKPPAKRIMTNHSTLSKKFYLRVKSQYQNLGDALINRELISLMHQHGALSVCLKEVPSNFLRNIMPTESGTINNFSPIIFFLSMVLSALKGESVFLFLNPGGYGGEISKSQFIKKRISIFFMEILSLCGVKICHIGVSYGDLGQRHSKAISCMAKVLYIHAVRDEISKKVADEKDIKINHVLPDLAFNLLTDEISEKNKSIPFFFSLREPKNKYSRNELIKKISLLSEIKIGFQVREDQKFCEAIASYLKKEEEVLNLTNSIKETSEFYKNCKYVISNRLHVLLLSAASGAIPIALIDPYENAKIIGVFEEMEMSHLIFNIEDFSTDIINNINCESDAILNQFYQAKLKLHHFFLTLK